MKSKFQVDVVWNLVGLVVLGISGLVLNTIIGRYRTPDALGLFNEVFAVYILLSQVCVGGIHFSVLFHISRRQTEADTCARIAATGLLLAGILSTLVCVVAYLSAPLADQFFAHEGVSLGIRLALPGVFIFAQNKVLLNVLNGHRHMRALAILQSSRFALIVTSAIGIIMLDWPDSYLPLALTISEMILFVPLAIYAWRHFGPIPIQLNGLLWLREHLRYGGRGFLSGFLTELNTRVDVIMLGWYLNENLVGIYSYAALIAEGVNQIPFAIRKNVDPVVGGLLANNEIGEIESRARKIKYVTYGVMLIVCAVAIVAYPVLLWMFLKSDEYSAGFAVLSILLVGVWLHCGYRPFYGLLLQGNCAGTQTMVVAATAAANIALNAMLIPYYGIRGAALATALVLILEACISIVLIRLLLRIRL